MKPLNHYTKKIVEKLDPVPTSVTLDKRHKKFLDDGNLNLSELIRDFLDDLATGKSFESMISELKTGSEK